VVIARGDAVALARALVQIDSRNPTLAPGSPGEGECARALASVLDDWGFSVEGTDSPPGRPNVIARLGPSDTPALMLNGHLDVVGVEGMIHISELDEAPVTKTEDVLKEGDDVEFVVLATDSEDRKFSLSRKAFMRGLDGEELRQYIGQAAGTKTAFAEAFNRAQTNN